MFNDDGHFVAQDIARRANEIYGECYKVDWAYIDNRNRVFNGSDYVARIVGDVVHFDRNDAISPTKVDLMEFYFDGGQ